MYALFFEDTGDLIATADREAHAIGLGRLVSREKGRAVIAVLNNDDGSTEVRWRFVQGRHVAAGAAEDVMPSAVLQNSSIARDEFPSP
jgi:hypothetical protein